MYPGILGIAKGRSSAFVEFNCECLEKEFIYGIDRRVVSVIFLISFLRKFSP